MRLECLADPPAALAKSKDGLHKVEFDGEPGGDLSRRGSRDGDFEGACSRRFYRLPALQRLE